MSSGLGDIPSGYHVEVNGHRFDYSVIDRGVGVIDLSIDGSPLQRTEIKEAPPDFRAWCATYVPKDRGPLSRGSGGGEQYGIVGGRLTHTSKRENKKTGKWEDVDTPLCNFAAWITSERVRDDGLERTLHLSIAGKLSNGQQLATLDVLAKDFASMAWVSMWGGRAVIHVGPYRKDHARAAIQYLSAPYKTCTTYTHDLGKIGDRAPTGPIKSSLRFPKGIFQDLTSIF